MGRRGESPGEDLVPRLDARPAHLPLRSPGPLLAMLRHSAELLSNKEAYLARGAAGRLHGYAVAQGLLLGQLGLRDAAAVAAAGGAALVSAR